jgi:hypothetical protein
MVDTPKREGRAACRWPAGRGHAEKVAQLSTVGLWIDRVVHALTVTPGQVVHASTVTPSRINGDAPNYILYSLYLKTPVVEAAQSVDNLAG